MSSVSLFRITNRLENLTSSLTAWKQLECGLSEFQEVLGKDKGALRGLSGALEHGRSSPVDLAHDVKEVAKLLSEKIEHLQVGGFLIYFI